MNGQKYDVKELLEKIREQGCKAGSDDHKEIRRSWKVIRESLPHMTQKDLDPTLFSLYKTASVFRFATTGRTRAIYHYGGSAGAALFATEWYHEVVHDKRLTSPYVYHYIAELYIMAIHTSLTTMSDLEILNDITALHNESLKMIGVVSEYRYSRPSILNVTLHKRLLTQVIFGKLKDPLYGLTATSNPVLFNTPYTQITQELFENFEYNPMFVGDVCQPVRKVEKRLDIATKLDLCLGVGLGLIEAAQEKNVEMGEDALHVVGHLLGEVIALVNPRFETTPMTEDKIKYAQVLAHKDLTIMLDSMVSPISSKIDRARIIHYIVDHLLRIHSVSKKKKQETPKQDRIIHAAWMLKPSALKKY